MAVNPAIGAMPLLHDERGVKRKRGESVARYDVIHPKFDVKDRCLALDAEGAQREAVVAAIRQVMEFGEWEFEFFLDFVGLPEPDDRHARWVKVEEILLLKHMKDEDRLVADAEEKGRRTSKRILRRTLESRRHEEQGTLVPPVRPPIPIRYVSEVVVGDKIMKTWYHPPGLGQKHFRVYFCPCCLENFWDEDKLEGHRAGCPGFPPGSPIYWEPEQGLAISKVDPEESAEYEAYCRSLSRLGACFIQAKQVVDDIRHFDFYVLRRVVDGVQSEVVGYFSKEKTSFKNNLACIAIFPPYQKRGYAVLLIDLSYKLAAREGIIGGPEEPLSKSGKAAYEKYWCWLVVKTQLEPFISHLHDIGELERDPCKMTRFIETGLLDVDPIKLCRHSSLPASEVGVPYATTVLNWISRKTAIRKDDVISVMKKMKLPMDFELKKDGEGRVRSMFDNDWCALLKAAFGMAKGRKMRLVDRARVVFDK